jgi:hypothetical protein
LEIEVDFFMLEALFGNQNIQKILLCLFVNGKCYGTQLHRLLKTPLTPIQKALERLENGGIILSHFEGKTRLYRFDPAFPVLGELEQLLKKTYTLLSPQEKKLYYMAREYGTPPLKEVNRPRVLLAFWEKLKTIRKVAFHARTQSKEAHGWDGKGKGEVVVMVEGPNCLIFKEKGSWEGKMGKEIGFSNVFRWTLDKEMSLISLDHLRRGWSNPVFLFHLAPTGQRLLSSIDSHLCEGDAYFGRMHFDNQSLRLSWRVIGPRKNEELDYYYYS